METRTYETSSTELRRSAISVLQDLGYTVDTMDSETGLITASRQTTFESGQIVEETDEDDDLPMWAKVAIVVTGIIIILLIIAVVTGDDDEEDESANQQHRDDHGDRHHHDAPVVAFSETIDAEDASDVYQYRLTLNMEPGDAEQMTRIRVSTQGAHYRGGKLHRAGPVHDPDFSSRFFAALEESIRLRSQGVSP